jgi:hypothetical protein
MQGKGNGMFLAATAKQNDVIFMTGEDNYGTYK